MAATISTSGLIDTDILIDATHKRPEALAVLSGQVAVGGIKISIVSAMELIQGSRNSTELSQTQQFLRRVSVVPINATSSQAARDLMERFFLSHGLVIPDALIAATALENDLVLYSKNIRHYRMIPNLSVVRPY
ncbi:MAG: type II toxin-antitoxin system VapC family toxin [Acidobacteriota bacterium]|nr:type II toxin-antitoxin system VapC family toxin [Acidobacteriota bacterium]